MTALHITTTAGDRVTINVALIASLRELSENRCEIQLSNGLLYIADKSYSDTVASIPQMIE